MDDFNIKKSTNYWIYAIPDKLWVEYNKYLDDSDPFYIGSFKYFDIPIGDIIIVYKKGSKNSGFVCIAQTKEHIIDNMTNKIKIYKDRNHHKYCAKLDLMTKFDPIKLTDIDADLKSVCKSYKSSSSFSTIYLKADAELNILDNNLGNNIMKKLLEMTNLEKEEIIIVPVIKAKPKSILMSIESESESASIISESELNSKSGSENENNQDNQNNIPILVILCDIQRNELLSGDYDDDIGRQIVAHISGCKHCDMTDNGNRYLDIYKLADNPDIEFTFNEIDSSEDIHDQITEAYWNLKNIINNNNNNQIKVYFISEEENMYNNSVFIDYI